MSREGMTVSEALIRAEMLLQRTKSAGRPLDGDELALIVLARRVRELNVVLKVSRDVTLGS